MPPRIEARDAARREAARLAAGALARSGLELKVIAEVLQHARKEQAYMRINGSDQTSAFGYADMLMLAADHRTREYVRLLIAPLLDMVDPHALRLHDFEAFARNSHTTEVARVALRPLAALLFPDQFADTAPKAASRDK